MSLKSEIVVDKVSPLGGLFEVKGKLQIKKQDDDRPIFEIDPNTGTISNDGFVLSNNDLDIPVFTFKDKSGFSILTDLTTETLSGRNNPNKGIKLQSNQSVLPVTGINNRITIGNIVDGLGSISINSDDQINYKGVKNSIKLFSSDTIITTHTFQDVSSSAAFHVKKVENKSDKFPHTNVLIGDPQTARNRAYTGTHLGYDGSTSFLGSGSRTIVKNQFEILQKTHFRGDVKIGVGSIDNFGAEAQTKFTHFTNFTSQLEEETTPGEVILTNINIFANQQFGGNGYFSFLSDNELSDGEDNSTIISAILQGVFDVSGFDGIAVDHPWACVDTTGLAANALVYNWDTESDKIVGTIQTGVGEGGVSFGPSSTGELDDNSKGQLTILAGKSNGFPGLNDGLDSGWLTSASLGHYGSDVSASMADESTGLQTTNPSQDGYVSNKDIGRDNQPAIKSKGSLTVLIDTDNDPEGRFFEVISGIPSIDFHTNVNNKSLLVITPEDERTAVKHLSSSGDLFASTSLSTNETTANSHKIVVIDTASGKFFHKNAESLTTFLSLSDTPDVYEGSNTIDDNGDLTPGISFESHSLVVGLDELGDPSVQFIQTVHSASHTITASYALTASHLLGEAEGIGFPYAGSDILGGNSEANPVIPAQAVITGSLLLSGSGNITASGHISASAVTASSFLGTFTGSLSGSVKNAETASFLDATASNATFAVTASHISGGIMSGSLFGSVTGSLFGTASWAYSASNAITASYISASNIDGVITATDATTAASGGSDTQPFYVVNDALVNGDLTVSGSLGVADSITLADITFSSSNEAFIFGSGSVNTITHQMTGNLAISASTGITLDVPENTAGFIGTSSWAISASHAIFASQSQTTVTASYILASGIEGDITAVNAVSASYVTGVMSGSMTGSFTGSMTGSLLGTASWAHSASNAISASYISASNIDGAIGFPYIGEAQITGSLLVSSSIHVETILPNLIGVFATASHAENAISASYISGGVMTGSLFGTASHALTASYINAIDIDGATGIGFPYAGSDDIAGTPAQAVITGSLFLSGSGNITASGGISASLGFTGSLEGTASHAESSSNAISASYILATDIEGDITATNAISASYVTGVMSGSITGSFTGSMTGSLLGTASLASFAESITDNTMFITQLKDVPDNGGAFAESNDNGYLSSHVGYILAVSGNNQEMTWTETASYASHSLSSSYVLSASHAVTAAFALNTTPSPTQFQALTDVSTTANSVDEDTSPLSYANIAWGAGNTIIYTTAHTGSFTGSFDGILTGSVHGTASHAESSSHAATASYIDVTDIEGNISATNALTASFVTGTMSGSLHGTASWAYSASNALFASESLIAISASYLSSFLDIDDVPNSYDLVGNYALIVNENNEEISFVQTVPSASVAITASYVSASNIVGEITATDAISASYVSGIMSGSLYGTASWALSASNALFASESLFAISASYVSGVMTGSLYGTSSWALSASNALTASYISSSNIDGIITATDATTAASGGSDSQPFHIVNDGFVSGNLVVCGSLGVAESVTLDDVVLEASSDAFIFGHNADNTITHQMTGNLELSASTGITANMSENIVGFHGTASHAESASHAATASYIDLGDIDGDFVGFPYAGSDILGGNPEANPVIPAQAVITGSLFLSGSGYITASNISASYIIANSLQINNAQKITGLDNADVAQDIAFITDGNILTFGDNDLDTTILGDDITLDSSNGIVIDSDTGEVLFQDGGATSITFNTTNGAITASGDISASAFSSSLSSGVGFYGSASYAITASHVITASHALTASYIDITDIEGTITSTNAISASYVTGVMSGSMTGSFTGSITGSLLGTASWAYSASNALSASYISGVLTGSLYGTASWAYNASSSIIAQTASFLLGDVESALSASYASSSSVAVNAGTASILTSYLNILDTPSTFADHASHSVVVNVDANALEFVQTVDSASVAVFASQSQLALTASYIDLEDIEGDLVTTFTALTDTFVPAGTVDDPYINNDVIIVHNNQLIMTGSVPLATTADTASHFEGTITNAEFATSHSVSASYVGPGGIMSGSLEGTASWAYSASQALFASESLIALSASYFSGVLTGSLHGTASQALFASESIVAISASYVSGVLTGSLYGTASWAETASHALNANPFPFEGFAIITGSLDLIGSITTQSNAIQNSLTDGTYVTSNLPTQPSFDLFRIFNNITGSNPSNDTSALWFENATSDITVDYNIYGKLGISPVIDRLGLMFNTEAGPGGSYNRQIQISGSNDDGVTFTPIAQEAYPSTLPSRSFAFNNINPYKLYRFTFPSDQNFNSITQDTSDSLGIEEIFLYSDQGSVTANNFYGPLQGTASYALTASISDFTISSSHAETASFFSGSIENAINAEFATSHSVSASYVGPDGIMSGSLHGTASWAYSASNALFASESLVAISASYFSGVLTGSLYGTASWALSASQALFASESLFAISASYFSGTLEADLTGTASYATLASQSETIQVSVSDHEVDSPILFSIDTTPAGEFVSVYADPSMSYSAFTDTFNVPHIKASSITASGNISASVFSSSTTNGIGFHGTASYAVTASHALNTIGGVGFPYAGSDTLGGDPAQAVITGSLFLSGSGNITASGHISASAITASSFTGSFSGSFSGSIKNAETASFLDATASYATHAISGGTVTQPFHVVNDAFVSGTLFVSGNIATAESITIHDVTISQSADAFTFGSGSNNTIVHQMTGNLHLSASTGITANMSENTVGFHGTASWAMSASNAISASYIDAANIEGTITATDAISASYVTGVMSGSVTGSFTGSMTGSLLGTASWAYSASIALFASESLFAISASYVSGVLTGSLYGTASWALSASNALFASESLSAISASYVSGVLTGSLYGTASWALSASQALFASESLSAISASYVSGVLTGSLYGTASWAHSASYALNVDQANTASGADTILTNPFNASENFPILLSSEFNPDPLDIEYQTVGVDAGEELTYNPVENILTVPHVSSSLASGIGFHGTASYAITASHAITSATSADTSTTSEFADAAGAIDLQLATEERHRIALTDLDGYGSEEKIFSPGVKEFVYNQPKNSIGIGIRDLIGAGSPLPLEGAQRAPHYRLELTNLIRIHGDSEPDAPAVPYTVLKENVLNEFNLNPIGKRYTDAGIVLSGKARSIYSATNISDGSTLDPQLTLDSDLVRMISYTSKGILSIGKSYQVNNGLHIHAGAGGSIKFFTELGEQDVIAADGTFETTTGPIQARFNKASLVNHNEGSFVTRGKLSVGAASFGGSVLSNSTPNDIQFIVQNPNNSTITDLDGLFINETEGANEGNSFGIICTSNVNYRGKFTLSREAFKIQHLPSPDLHTIPLVINTMKNSVSQVSNTEIPAVKQETTRLLLDNQKGTFTLPANHGVTDIIGETIDDAFYSRMTKSQYKLFIEGTHAPQDLSTTTNPIFPTAAGVLIEMGPLQRNLQGSSFIDTGKALHVNNGISHFGGSTVIGSPFRPATHTEQDNIDLLGDNFGNLLGAVTASITGEPLETPNSSSGDIILDGQTAIAGDYSPSFNANGDPINNIGGPSQSPLHTNCFALHSMGGEYFYNAESTFTDGTGESGASTPNFGASVFNAQRNDVSPATDFKLFVNGVSFRGFRNNRAIKSIGLTQLMANDFYNPGTFPSSVALSVTGSSNFLGNSFEVNAAATFNNSLTLNGTLNHTGDYEIDGNITIGGNFATSPSSEGNNIFIGPSAVAQSSDRKLKQNIVDLDLQLDNIKALQPREFEWKHNKVKSKGLIAQELQEVYPSLVNEHKDTLYVNYTGMVPMLIKGMQEQQEIIEKLTSKVNELEKKIDK